MILVGRDFRAVAESAVVGADEDLIEGMSLEVRSDEDVHIPPGQYKTFPAKEEIDMPTGVTAQVSGRSTHMRDGVFMPTGWIDPGYEGKLTLEVVNHSDHPYVIGEGERAAKLVLHRLYERVEPYEGEYGDD